MNSMKSDCECIQSNKQLKGYLFNATVETGFHFQFSVEPKVNAIIGINIPNLKWNNKTTIL